MPVPEAVTIETSGYRAETDPLADFIAERCRVGNNMEAHFGDLYVAYCSGQKPATSRHEKHSHASLGRRLSQTYKKKTGGGPSHYYGIALRRRT